MKEIYEMKGAGRSIREIARELDVSRNTVRRHLWLASEDFSLSAGNSDTQQFPVALYHRMVDSLAYAA